MFLNIPIEFILNRYSGSLRKPLKLTKFQFLSRTAKRWKQWGFALPTLRSSLVTLLPQPWDSIAHLRPFASRCNAWRNIDYFKVNQCLLVSPTFPTKFSQAVPASAMALTDRRGSYAPPFFMRWAATRKTPSCSRCDASASGIRDWLSYTNSAERIVTFRATSGWRYAENHLAYRHASDWSLFHATLWHHPWRWGLLVVHTWSWPWSQRGVNIRPCDSIYWYTARLPDPMAMKRHPCRVLLPIAIKPCALNVPSKWSTR